MNFTFKTTKSTGRYRSFHPDVHDIKLNKKLCGHIFDEKPYVVSFMTLKKDVKNSDNPNCIWTWQKIKTPEFNNVNEAKQWVKERTKDIIDFFNKKETPLFLQD